MVSHVAGPSVLFNLSNYTQFKIKILLRKTIKLKLYNGNKFLASAILNPTGKKVPNLKSDKRLRFVQSVVKIWILNEKNAFS